MKTRRGTNTKVAKTISADVSAMGMSLISKANKLIRELKGIEGVLIGDTRLIDKSGADSAIVRAMEDAVQNVSNARAKLSQAATLTQGWILDVETGFMS